MAAQIIKANFGFVAMAQLKCTWTGALRMFSQRITVCLQNAQFHQASDSNLRTRLSDDLTGNVARKSGTMMPHDLL